MYRRAKTAIGLAVVATCGAAFGAPGDKLEVQLSLANAVVQGDADIAVNVAITNSTDHAVKVLEWQLPSSRLPGQLFRVTAADGTPARYLGPMVKRAAPRESDFVTIEAGATRNYQVNLGKTYELGNGRYTVKYVSSGGGHVDATPIESATPVDVWTQGRSAALPLPSTAASQGAVAEAASIGFTGGCTTRERQQLRTAVNAATAYSRASYSYLSDTPSRTQRYVQWFGAFTPARWNEAKTDFLKIRDAFVNKPLTLDCSCNNGAYAYVFPNQPYKIYLCNAFWTAPNRGTDSRGGTLVHEMSHFDIVANTDDNAYGQSACAALAQSDPLGALNNADSHEYFAENNPFQP
jgi:peptidyl-Lys metalloendopeptidase